jgi:hypothetical protein
MRFISHKRGKWLKSWWLNLTRDVATRFLQSIFSWKSHSRCLKDFRFPQLMFRGVLYKILCHSIGIVSVYTWYVKELSQFFPFSISNNFETNFKKRSCCGIFWKIFCDIELYKNLRIGNPLSSPPCVLMERDCIVFGPEEEEGKISSLIFFTILFVMQQSSYNCLQTKKMCFFCLHFSWCGGVGGWGGGGVLKNIPVAFVNFLSLCIGQQFKI